MERALRALSERIRFIEGFDVEILVKTGQRLPSSLRHYGFSRAASRKWSIEYWEEKRNQWEFLEFKVRGSDGEILSSQTPLDIPRKFYHRQFGFMGERIQAKIECKTDHVAMQLRRELLTVGIDAVYRVEKFLFFKTHLLEWMSPNLRMNVFEREAFEKNIRERVKKLDSEVDLRHVPGELACYLDECPRDYRYISCVEDLEVKGA